MGELWEIISLSSTGRPKFQRIDEGNASRLPTRRRPRPSEIWRVAYQSKTKRLWVLQDPDSWNVGYAQTRESDGCSDIEDGQEYELITETEHHRGWLHTQSKQRCWELCATNPEGAQLICSVRLHGRTWKALIDSGATGNYVSTYAANWMKTRRKQEPYELLLVDGKAKRDNNGVVSEETTPTTMKMGHHHELISLDVTPMGRRYQIILGMPWMQKHNPSIDWARARIVLDRCGCSKKASHEEISATSHEGTDHPAQGSPIGQIPTEYKEFSGIFEEGPRSEALPKHKPWDHEIPLEKGSEPPFGPIYGLSANELKVLKGYIDENLEKGFIRHSTSSAGSPVLFAPKKDGSLRLCIDYRKLNEMTIKDRYALPLANELRDRLGQAKIFTKLDLRGAYNLIRMKEGEEWKTAFRTRYGHFEYLVMPFGLTNAPATCMRLMNNVLAECLDIFAIAYLDDILVYSESEQKHVEHVKQVLTLLQEYDLLLKPEKCEFHVTETEFLGFMVSTEGLAMSQNKVKSVMEWPTPTTVKEVQAFLGFANFYRRFIQGYSRIATPLSELTKKDQDFKWTKEADDALKELRDAFTTAPILTTFDPEKHIVVETDASDYAIGACISQPDDRKALRPVAYFSRKMSAPELNYDIHDKELLAVVEAFKEWRVYLEGSKYPVMVYTDHKNLIYFTTTKQLNRRQTRWAETMATFNFRITYRKGTENARADALSRRPDYMSDEKLESHAIFREEQGELVYNRPQLAATLTISAAPTLEWIRSNYDKDPIAKEARERPTGPFTCEDGTILMKGLVYIPQGIREEFVKQEHEHPAHGHQGIRRTKERMMRNYYFPGLAKTVEKVITNCDTCIKSKPARHAPYGMLKSPDMPTRAWTSIAWDFIVKLPASKEPITEATYDSIFVVTDRLTKYAYFIPYKESSTAEELAYTFLRIVIANHGLPDEIISDRDKLFTSHFWTTLTASLGTKAKLSTAFHPQTDGQTERLNQTLEQYLRCYVNYRQTNWVQLLPLAQFAYNSASTEATKTSPFYANYGYEPQVSKAPIITQHESEKATLHADELRALQQQLSSDITFISSQTAKYYNKKRSMEPTLKEGDKVYLLRKNVKTQRPSDKLDYKKLGPFKIEKVVGPVNYRLTLPKSMEIHPVFHISLLEPAPPGAPNTPTMPTEIKDRDEPYDVGKVLDSKYVRHKLHYLIKWLDYPDTENSWEPAENLNCPEKLAGFHRENPVRPRMPGPGPAQGQGRRGRGRGAHSDR